MSERRYTDEHEWIALDGDVAAVGVSAYAQEQLGDVVFVELPKVGRVLAQGEEAAVIESVKAASELYAPVAGEVVAVNERLAAEPGLVNADPTGEGWFLRLRVAGPAQIAGLMDGDAYRAFVESLE